MSTFPDFMDGPLRVDDLLGVLVVAIVVPVVLGAMLGERRPQRRLRWFGFATAVSNVSLVGALAVGLLGSAVALVGALFSGVMIAAVIVVIAAGLIGAALPDLSGTGVPARSSR